MLFLSLFFSPLINKVILEFTKIIQILFAQTIFAEKKFRNSSGNLRLNRRAPYSRAIPIFSRFTRIVFEKCRQRLLQEKGREKERERESFTRELAMMMRHRKIFERDSSPSAKERRLRLIPPVSGQEQIELLILDGVPGWRLGGQGWRDRR